MANPEERQPSDYPELGLNLKSTKEGQKTDEPVQQGGMGQVRDVDAAVDEGDDLNDETGEPTEDTEGGDEIGDEEGGLDYGPNATADQADQKKQSIARYKQIAAAMRRNAKELRKKAEFSAGDLFCIVMAIIKDLGEIVLTIVLGLGIIIGSLVSFFISVIWFFVRQKKGITLTKNMIEGSLIWVADAITPDFPIYTIAMIWRIWKDAHDAKKEAAHQERLAEDLDKKIKALK